MALAVIPGFVTANVYITGAQSGSLGPTATNQNTLACGFSETGHTDTGVFTTNAVASGSLGTATASFNAVETGGSGGTGYEYLVDELAFGCKNIPLGTIATIDLQICGYGEAGTALTSLVYASVCTAQSPVSGIVGADFVELDTAVSSTGSAPQPAFGTNPASGTSTVFCASNAAVTSATAADLGSTQGATAAQKQEVIFDDAAPGVLGSSIANTADTGYAYVPGDISGYSLAAGNLAYNTAATGCGTVATGTAAADTTYLNKYAPSGSNTAGTETDPLQFVTDCTGSATNAGCAGSATAIVYYAYFSLAIVDETAAGLGTCAYTASGTTSCGSGSGSAWAPTTAMSASTTLFTISFAASDGAAVGS